jgi:hypothetical protein
MQCTVSCQWLSPHLTWASLVVRVRPLVTIEIMFTVSVPLPVLSRYEEAVRGGTGSFGDAGLVGQDPNV